LSLVAPGKVADVRFGVLAALVLLASACGGSDGARDKGGNGIRVTREDGSQVKFPDEVHAWCGPGPFAPQAEHERAPTPPKPRELWIVGGQPPAEEAEEADTFWVFSWPTKSIERSPRIELPDEGEALHAALFVYDSETPNELSSSEEDAKGVIEVEKWGCEKGDTVHISVEATLDGELFETPTASAEGEVETVIGDPLPIPD
jgi:hypothetical protein